MKIYENFQSMLKIENLLKSAKNAKKIPNFEF